MEGTPCCTRNCVGSIRSFDMKLMDTSDNEVIHITSPMGCDCFLFACCLKKLDVYAAGGQKIGTIEQKWTVFCPVFYIKNTTNETVITIKGPFCKVPCCNDIDFQVFIIVFFYKYNYR